MIRLAERPDDVGALVTRLSGRQLVVTVQDAHRHLWERATVDALLAATGDAIVVETGLDVWRPAGASGYVATHGAGRVNLEAAADQLLGG